MTANQIRARELNEAKRHNVQSEGASWENAKANRRTSVANATNARTRRDELNETVRHNKQGESLTKRGQTLKAGTDTLSSATGLVGKLFGNDKSWYNMDPQLVKDVASISYEEAIGYLSPEGYFGPAKLAAPGIQVLKFCPMIGRAGKNDVSLATLVARNWYSAIRRKNSGGSNYDPPDLYMYMLTNTSAYMLAAHIRRCYSVVNTAKGRNRYYPAAMAAALGFDFQDAVENISNYRGQLNTLLIQLNSLYLPDISPVLKRWVWMCSNIFKDSDIHKSSEYVFVPEYYFVWNEDGGLTATLCPRGTLGEQGGTMSSLPTLQEWLNALSALLTLLLEDQDVGNIAGDIKKAADAGEFGLYSADTIPDDYHVESGFSLEVLSQINNAIPMGCVNTSNYTFLASDSNLAHFNVQQNLKGEIFQAITDDSSDLYMGPVFITAQSSNDPYNAQLSVGNNGDRILNMYKDSPDPDDNMVATRLMATATYTPVGTSKTTSADASSVRAAPVNSLYAVPDSYGTELISVIEIYAYKLVGTASTLSTWVIWDLIPANNLNLDSYEQFILQDSFDWGACPRSVSVESEEGLVQITGVIHTGRDLCNYAWISSKTLANTHRVAVLSEYGIPLLAK